MKTERDRDVAVTSAAILRSSVKRRTIKGERERTIDLDQYGFLSPSIPADSHGCQFSHAWRALKSEEHGKESKRERRVQDRPVRNESVFKEKREEVCSVNRRPSVRAKYTRRRDFHLSCTSCASAFRSVSLFSPQGTSLEPFTPPPRLEPRGVRRTRVRPPRRPRV